MYTLYGYPNTRSFRVLWALEEAVLAYDYKVVNLYKGEHKSKDYLSLSPSGKVPLLSTPDGVVSESSAILAYLATKHGSPLVPDKADAEQLGRVFEMQSFITCELEQPLWTLAKHTFALPENKRVEAIKATARWEYEKALGVFSVMLSEREFAAGDAFSFADILASHTLTWAEKAKVSCDFSNLNQYQNRVIARHAYHRAVEIETEKLAVLNK